MWLGSMKSKLQAPTSFRRLLTCAVEVQLLTTIITMKKIVVIIILDIVILLIVFMPKSL